MNIWKTLKTFLKIIPVLLLLACVEPEAKPITPPDSLLFAGSTPCDAWIRNRLQVTDSAGCEFIKWEMKLLPAGDDTGKFELLINYGVSQPNTNGFKSGGKKLTVMGSYNSEPGGSSKTSSSILVLYCQFIAGSSSIIHTDLYITSALRHGKTRRKTKCGNCKQNLFHKKEFIAIILFY